MYADDLLQLLERCKSGLKEDGLVIVKENVCERGFVVDPVRNWFHLCYVPVCNCMTVR